MAKIGSFSFSGGHTLGGSGIPKVDPFSFSGGNTLGGGGIPKGVPFSSAGGRTLGGGQMPAGRPFMPVTDQYQPDQGIPPAPMVPQPMVPPAPEVPESPIVPNETSAEKAPAVDKLTAKLAAKAPPLKDNPKLKEVQKAMSKSGVQAEKIAEDPEKWMKAQGIKPEEVESEVEKAMGQKIPEDLGKWDRSTMLLRLGLKMMVASAGPSGRSLGALGAFGAAADSVLEQQQKDMKQARDDWYKQYNKELERAQAAENNEQTRALQEAKLKFEKESANARNKTELEAARIRAEATLNRARIMAAPGVTGDGEPTMSPSYTDSEKLKRDIRKEFAGEPAAPEYTTMEDREAYKSAKSQKERDAIVEQKFNQVVPKARREQGVESQVFGAFDKIPANDIESQHRFYTAIQAKYPEDKALLEALRRRIEPNL